MKQCSLSKQRLKQNLLLNVVMEDENIYVFHAKVQEFANTTRDEAIAVIAEPSPASRKKKST